MKKASYLLLAVGVILLVLYIAFLRPTAPHAEQVNTPNDAGGGSVGEDKTSTSATGKSKAGSIEKNQLLPANPDKTVWLPYLYPGTKTMFLTRGVKHDRPLVEMRFWKKSGEQKVPWDGKTAYISCKSMNVPDSDALEIDCWFNEDGDPQSPVVPMHAFRYALFPPDFVSKSGQNIREILRLGQAYEIDFRGDKGVQIGRAMIHIPDKLAKGEVVVYDLIANEFNPPKPKVYYLIGKVSDLSVLGTVRSAYLIPSGARGGRINEQGEFSFWAEAPLSGTVVISGSGAEDPVLVVADASKGTIEIPRDATYLAKKEELTNIQVQIPPEFMPKNDAGRGIYYLTYPDKKVMRNKELIFSFHRDKIYPKEVDNFRKTRLINLKCLPGEYAVYGLLAMGSDLVKVGKIKVSKSDDGKILKLTPEK